MSMPGDWNYIDPNTLERRRKQRERYRQKHPRKQARGLYEEIRESCHAMEELIGQNSLPEKTLKRLDKAVTVMKVGFKIIKKALKEQSRKGAVPVVMAAAKSAVMH